MAGVTSSSPTPSLMILSLVMPRSVPKQPANAKHERRQRRPHSEFNLAPDRPTHLLPIWIQPQQPGGTPRYAELKLGTAAPLGIATRSSSAHKPQRCHQGRLAGTAVHGLLWL